MASIVQAPFYAPRPSDDPCWQWSPPVASQVIRQLAHQKFFGALGQVPTKLWSPYLYDDPALTWAPAFQNGPVRVTLTQTKFQGQPGQAVTRRWSQFYTYVEPPDWSPTLENLNSSAIPPLSRLGVAKTYKWSPIYTFDDPGVWYPTPESFDSDIIAILGKLPFVNEWQFNYDEGALWQPDINWMTSAPIQILTGNKEPFSNEYQFNFDDASPWVPWFKRNLAVLTPPSTTPFSNEWQPNYDDPALWSFTYQPNNPSVTVLPPVQFYAPLYVPNPPDIQGWQWTPSNNLIIGVQLTQLPISSIDVNFLDDPAIWVNWISRNSAVLATPGGKPVSTAGEWNYNIDDPQMWSWAGLPKSIALTTVQNPFTPRQWAFGLSADEPWQWSVPRAQPLSMLNFKPFSPRFIPTYDEPGWTGALRPVPMTLTAVAPHPFTPLQWGFGYDDSAVWTGQSHNSFFTQHQPIPFVASMWNLNWVMNIPQDTPSSAYSTPAAALTLPPLPSATLIQRTLTGVGI